ncbi:MAG: efflux RND transporter periplasmic adaptor subunit [Planctomycetaceae bacterium]|jgi:putative peptide zinc metalloprotease protein|nr:efflux RND transporter periplasmic adaptor subunit [Planctomycetaceae bacterium]
MVTLADSLVSSSARKLPIKVRPDVVGKKQQYLGRSYWVVKDPIGSKYFRFQEEEYAILQMLDGTRSLDEVKEKFETDFPPQKITLEELQSFIGQLHQNGLIIAAVPNQGHQLKKRGDKKKKQMFWASISNILSVRFKGFDPDRLLTWLEPKFRFMFHPVIVFLTLATCLTALSLVMVEFDYFRSKLPEFREFFGVKNIFLLSLTLGVTKVIHEFGHGITCKHFGGECHEMGVMLLVLTPCLYVNVSDSWMLPSKWKRAMIGAAGVYVECFIASVCTFFWWFSQPGLFNYLCLNVMFVSSVSTIIFNINPLLRYDGYYILADMLEIPNLRQKATKILSRKSMEWFLGMEQSDDPFLPKRNQMLFAFYTVAAVCYRWVVMASILFFIYKVFEPIGLKIIGQTIAAMSLYGLVVMPVVKIVKFFWVPGRIYKVKRIRFFLSLSVLFGIIAFILFCPLPYHVYGPMTVMLQRDSSQIYVPSKGGALIGIHVKPGQQVAAGKTLASLRNKELELELKTAENREKIAEMELASLERRQHVDESVVSSIPAKKREIKTYSEQKLELQNEVNKLKLTTPISGTIIPPEWRRQKEQSEDGFLPSWWGTPLENPQNLGATLEPGTLFCEVGDPKKVEVIIVVNQSKIDFIAKGQRVELKFEELPGRTFHGEVIDIEHRQMASIPIQLTVKGKGEIATSSTPEGLEKPLSSSYRVNVLLDLDFDNTLISAENPLIKVGMTGRAKIHVAPQTLAIRAWRTITEIFNFQL